MSERLQGLSNLISPLFLKNSLFSSTPQSDVFKPILTKMVDKNPINSFPDFISRSKSAFKTDIGFMRGDTHISYNNVSVFSAISIQIHTFNSMIS